MTRHINDEGWQPPTKFPNGHASHTFRVFLTPDRTVTSHVATVFWSLCPEERYYRYWPEGNGSCPEIEFPDSIETLDEAKTYVEALWRMGTTPEGWNPRP